MKPCFLGEDRFSEQNEMINPFHATGLFQRLPDVGVKQLQMTLLFEKPFVRMNTFIQELFLSMVGFGKMGTLKDLLINSFYFISATVKGIN